MRLRRVSDYDYRYIAQVKIMVAMSTGKLEKHF